MERRGRPSVGGRTLAIVPGSRPPPPDDLTPEQAEIWDGIMCRMPESWATPGVEPLLIQYCRHCDYARWLAARISEVMSYSAEIRDEQLPGWLRLHGAQSERIVSLSRTLRLSPSSQYSGRRAGQFAGRSTPARKPWEWRDDN